VGLKQRISISDFRADKLSPETFEEQNDEFKSCLRAFDSDLKIFEKRSQEMSLGKGGQSVRRGYFEMFLKTIGVGHGKRRGDVQTRFKKALIADYAAAVPKPRSGSIWCNLSGSYFSRDIMVAAHIFPSALGQGNMTAIFGTEDELYTSRNGLLMRKDLEKRFDKHWIAIVPLADYTSAEEVQEWSKGEPQRWKIQVMNPKPQQMRDELDWDTKKTYLDLDDQELAFRNSSRPRAHYLYFHYLVALVKLCYHEDEHEQLTKDQAGNPVWATAGKYLKESMLLAFVEEIGHEELMANAISEGKKGKEADVDELALEAANTAIELGSRSEEGSDEEEDSDEDSSDSEEEA